MNGSRDPGRQLARYRAPSRTADSSLRRAWNTTRRHGLSPDRTASYPLLAARKTRTYGGRRSTRDVCRTGRLLGGQQRRRSAASFARKRFISSYNSITASQKDTFCDGFPHLRASAHQPRAREVAATDRLDKDMVVLRPIGAHLQRIVTPFFLIVSKAGIFTYR